MNANPPEEQKKGVITMDDYVGENGYMVKFAGDYLDNDIDIDDIDFERLEAMQSGKKIKKPKQKQKKKKKKQKTWI